jgi:hypothetical protein
LSLFVLGGEGLFAVEIVVTDPKKDLEGGLGMGLFLKVSFLASQIGVIGGAVGGWLATRAIAKIRARQHATQAYNQATATAAVVDDLTVISLVEMYTSVTTFAAVQYWLLSTLAQSRRISFR